MTPRSKGRISGRASAEQTARILNCTLTLFGSAGELFLLLGRGNWCLVARKQRKGQILTKYAVVGIGIGIGRDITLIDVTSIAFD